MVVNPDFLEKTRQTLAKRAGQVCSNPGCRKPTSGPHSEEDKSVNLGEAAHIRAARQNQARFDPNMTGEDRRHISNGIWLCRECARKPLKYPLCYCCKYRLTLSYTCTVHPSCTLLIEPGESRTPRPSTLHIKLNANSKVPPIVR